MRKRKRHHIRVISINHRPRLGAGAAMGLHKLNFFPVFFFIMPGIQFIIGLVKLTGRVIRDIGKRNRVTVLLIAAYREAARMALSEAEIVERHDMSEISFTFPYLAMNDVMKLTKSGEAEIKSQIFDNSCEMTLAIRADEADKLRNRLADIDGVSIIS